MVQAIFAKEKAMEEGKVLQGGTTDDDGYFPRRDGTLATCCAHVITAVIGSGILSLGFAIAQVGWVFGPLLLIIFASITMMTATMLCEPYRNGDPHTGTRNKTYKAAVYANLGRFDQIFCATIQYLSMFFSGVGYTVTAALSLVAAKRAVCFHHHAGTPAREAPCSFESTLWTVLFGGINVICAQIPNFGHLWWLSYVAAICSFGYALIGLGLAIGKSTEGGHPDYGTALGINHAESTPAKTVWNVFTALGNIAFSYSYNLILVEIQDTIKQPEPAVGGKPAPTEVAIMKKASQLSITITTLFYLCVGCLSYSAFGDATPGNLLTGFGFFNPYWLVTIANIFVFVHLIGAYQVFMQPLMQAIEDLIRQTFPNVTLLQYEIWYEVPFLQHIALSPLMLISRTVMVAATTVLACLLPFFNAIVSLMGSISFFPLTVYFPIQMWLKRHQIPKGDLRYILLQGLCFLALLISLCAATGAVEGIIDAVKDYQPFKNKVNSLGSGQTSS